MQRVSMALVGAALVSLLAIQCSDSSDESDPCDGPCTTSPSGTGAQGGSAGEGGGAGLSSSGGGGAGGATSGPESYLDILDEAVGFAQPDGGAVGPRIFVTSLDDSGPGTLREALALPGAKWISFTEGLTGTIDAESWLSIPSDTTVDGRGADVTVSGNGMTIDGSSNVIVTHMKFDATSNDEVRIIHGAGPAWIHHCTFRDYGDGAIDITGGADQILTDVTVSWCHVDHGSKASLVSSTSDPASGNFDWNIYVTFHHNYFDGNSERSPRTRFAKVHHFNNYLREAGYIGASTLAEIIVENDIFETDSATRATYVNCIGGDCDFNSDWGLAPDEGGALKGAGNWLDAGTTTASYATANEGQVFQEFSGQVPPYPYSLEPADDGLRSSIAAGAGWRSVPLPPD